jgi:hypothetical protein
MMPTATRNGEHPRQPADEWQLKRDVLPLPSVVGMISDF